MFIYLFTDVADQSECSFVYSSFAFEAPHFLYVGIVRVLRKFSPDPLLALFLLDDTLSFNCLSNFQPMTFPRASYAVIFIRYLMSDLPGLHQRQAPIFKMAPESGQ
jgi:hypothetical protein